MVFKHWENKTTFTRPTTIAWFTTDGDDDDDEAMVMLINISRDKNTFA